MDVEIRAKVIYESGGDNIINQYIVFCKVFNEQVKLYGMTREAVTETIRICKDRNVLKQYLISKEVEVVTIMMSLFDEEQIMDIYVQDVAKDIAQDMAKDMAQDMAKDIAQDMAKEADRATARRMIKDGEMPLEKIARYVPSLSLDDLKKMKTELLQPA